MGANVELTLGASIDDSGLQMATHAHVLTLAEGASDADRQAVVAIDGITVILAAKRRSYHDLTDFYELGLDPNKTNLLAVKSGYLSPDLEPIANPSLMALSQGAVNQDIPALENHNRPAGTFPFDSKADYSPKPRASARFKERYHAEDHA